MPNTSRATALTVAMLAAPTLAALFMRAPKHDPNAKPGFGERLVAQYERGLRKALAHQRLMLGIFCTTLNRSML